MVLGHVGCSVEARHQGGDLCHCCYVAILCQQTMVCKTPTQRHQRRAKLTNQAAVSQAPSAPCSTVAVGRQKDGAVSNLPANSRLATHAVHLDNNIPAGWIRLHHASEALAARCTHAACSCDGAGADARVCAELSGIGALRTHLLTTGLSRRAPWHMLARHTGHPDESRSGCIAVYL